VRYAFDHLAGGTTARGRIAARAAGLAPLVRLLPGSGAVARRRGAPAPLAWLREHVPEARLDSVVLSTSAAAVVLHVVEPGAVVKVGSTEARLVELGPAVRAAGAAVPEVLGSGTVGGRPLVVQSTVEGRPASLVLARHPQALGRVVESITAWLGRWNRATAHDAPVTRALLERELLEPAAALSPELPYGRAYVDRLAQKAERADGTTMPFVSAHQDLTMANVLVGDDGSIGVVDWAAASPRALPLGDLVYALVDAQAAADRYTDPAASFARCFAPGGLAEGPLARAAASLGLDGAAVELCVHACWLGHARNEAARPEGTRPFLRILRRLVEEL